VASLDRFHLLILDDLAQGAGIKAMTLWPRRGDFNEDLCALMPCEQRFAPADMKGRCATKTVARVCFGEGARP
jgi:hypothetical protein